MVNEDDEEVDLDLTDTAFTVTGATEEQEWSLLLLDAADGHLKELLKLEVELSEIIEWQAERRAHLKKIRGISSIRDWLVSLRSSRAIGIA